MKNELATFLGQIEQNPIYNKPTKKIHSKEKLITLNLQKIVRKKMNICLTKIFTSARYILAGIRAMGDDNCSI